MYVFLLFIIIGFLVLTSTIVMTIWFKTNRILNFYLIFTSISLCLYLVLHGLNNCILIGGNINLWSINYYQVVLVLTPSAYLFFEKLIFNSKYPDKRDLYYFIIPVLFFFHLSSGEFKHFFIEKSLVFILFVLYVTFFCCKSYSILKKYVWNDNYNLDALNPIVKNWADFVFKMMLMVFVHFFIFFISRFFVISESLNLLIESSLLIVFLIAYFKVIFSPLLLYGSPRLEKISNSNVVSKLHINKVWGLDSSKSIYSSRDMQIHNRIKDKVSGYIERIENIALLHFSFRKLDYSINELSTELGVPKYYLEFIFKYYCKISFNDYKKVVRVYDAIRLINEGYLSSNTLDTLSRHVGFASYNPFLINFKELTGVSPFEFNKNRKISKSDSFLKGNFS